MIDTRLKMKPEKKDVEMMWTNYISLSPFFCIPILGFLFFYYACYPGYMSPDSLAQYYQAKHFIFDDWHPPIMALLWGGLNIVTSGPQGLLVCHLLLLWGSLSLLFVGFRTGFTPYLVFFIGFMPWIANFEGVLWKDVSLAYSLLLAFSIMITTRKNIIWIALVTVLLLYAFMVRHNGCFAILPLLWLLAHYIQPNNNNYKALAFVSIIICVFFVVSDLINYHILRAHRSHPAVTLMWDDLARMSVQLHHNPIPHIGNDNLDECNRLPGNTFGCYIDHHKGLDAGMQVSDALPESWEFREDRWQEFKKAWLHEISSHPLFYIKNRLTTYQFFLKSPSRQPYYYYFHGISPNNQGINHINNELSLALRNWVMTSAHMTAFFYKPYFWLIASILLSFLTFFLQGDKFQLLCIRSLLASGLLYITGYLPIIPGLDFRFVYWTVVTVTLVVILLIISPNLYLNFNRSKNFIDELCFKIHERFHRN